MPTLPDFNRLSPTAAAALLLTACGSRRWCSLVTARRPLATHAALLSAADAAFDQLADADWLEAFAHHPRIGESKAPASATAAGAALSTREQSGMAVASADVRQAFLRGNEQYERTFGRVFLICASGKSADDMLAALTARLANDATTELAIARREQRLITRLRLGMLRTP